MTNIVLFGKKIGSTQVFEESGESVHVTVIEIANSNIVEYKTKDKDGYSSVICATSSDKNSSMNSPQKGMAKKHNLGAFGKVYEIRVEDDSLLSLFEKGTSIGSSSLKNDVSVEIRSKSKGKGFAGTIKRWNFAGQDRSHGNSLAHRVPGSIGGNQPGRVWKGKKMSGHMGDAYVTLRAVPIIKKQDDKNLIFIKGPVPGCYGTEVRLKQCYGE
jgi:large subunit ribosomal protein L3